MVALIRSKTNAGDFILAYDDLAWIYYLTDTRPAMRSALTTTGRLPERTERLWLDDMRRRARTPHLVVTRRPLAGKTPFARFIAEHYAVSVRSGSLTVWEPLYHPPARRLTELGDHAY